MRGIPTAKSLYVFDLTGAVGEACKLEPSSTDGGVDGYHLDDPLCDLTSLRQLVRAKTGKVVVPDAEPLPVVVGRIRPAEAWVRHVEQEHGMDVDAVKAGSVAIFIGAPGTWHDQGWGAHCASLLIAGYINARSASVLMPGTIPFVQGAAGAAAADRLAMVDFESVPPPWVFVSAIEGRQELPGSSLSLAISRGILIAFAALFEADVVRRMTVN